MAIRIVNEDGKGYTTRIYDAETGEDLTATLLVNSLHIELDPANAVIARLTTWTPKIEITIDNPEMKQICPYCGHQSDFPVDSKEE